MAAARRDDMDRNARVEQHCLVCSAQVMEAHFQKAEIAGAFCKFAADRVRGARPGELHPLPCI